MCVYLLGDIFDDLYSEHWSLQHREALTLLLEFSKIVYLPGNHDEALRRLIGLTTDHVRVRDSFFVHEGSLVHLVIHGDQFDPSLRFAIGPRWLRSAFSSMFSGSHGRLMTGIIRKNAVEHAKRLVPKTVRATVSVQAILSDFRCREVCRGAVGASSIVACA